MSQSVSMNKISIALATYNGASYLREQLDSFLAQTRLPDELVVSDDGSHDNTLTIVKAFQKNAPFEVVLLQNEVNVGYSGNFNRALMRTTGDLVFLSDQDDVWFPDKIERMVSEAGQHTDSLVIMNDAALTDAYLNDSGLTKLGQIRSAGLSDSTFVMGCCAVVKRDLLDICLPIDARYKSHDKWIVLFADGMGRKRIISEVLQSYRRHGSNESNLAVNRTVKFTRHSRRMMRLSWYRRHLLSLLKAECSNDQHQQSTDMEEILLEGLRDAARKAPEPYRSELLGYVETYGRSISTKKANMAERFLIRQKPRFRRIGRVIGLWRRGVYRDYSGVNSAVRDIFFD